MGVLLVSAVEAFLCIKSQRAPLSVNTNLNDQYSRAIYDHASNGRHSHLDDFHLFVQFFLVCYRNLRDGLNASSSW